MNRQLEILQQCTEDGDAWTQEQLTKFDAHELPVESQKCCTPYVQQLKARAEEGNAEAQFLLGWEYANGEVRNYKTAAEWFRKAAEQGNAPAQRELGCMYYDGDGVAQDFEQAVAWWKKAAEAGDCHAMGNLGYYYLDNAPEAPDYASVVKWWKQAAEHGDSTAAYNLHIYYHNGESVKKDENEASRWLLRSAKLGHAQAQYMVYLDWRVNPDNNGLGLYWVLRSAEQGFHAAKEECKELEDEEGNQLINLETPGAIQFLLGVLHENGYCGLAPNAVEAVKWYHKAAQADHPGALFQLGECYEQGLLGVAVDPERANSYYRRAAELGDEEAQAKLG